MGSDEITGHVAAKFVPWILTADQKQQRVDVCTELSQLASDNETHHTPLIWHPVTSSYIQK
jgi:hypothetical protein